MQNLCNKKPLKKKMKWNKSLYKYMCNKNYPLLTWFKVGACAPVSLYIIKIMRQFKKIIHNWFSYVSWKQDLFKFTASALRLDWWCLTPLWTSSAFINFFDKFNIKSCTKYLHNFSLEFLYKRCYHTVLNNFVEFRFHFSSKHDLNFKSSCITILNICYLLLVYLFYIFNIFANHWIIKYEYQTFT
jgi:hypothetical protein